MKRSLNDKFMSLLLLFVLALSGCQTQMDAQQTSVSKIQASLKSPVIKQTPTPAFAAYVLVGSGQAVCYDNKNVVACPVESSAFYGQDAQFTRNRPAYRDNGDGTVSDLVTGLMWQQDPGIKMSYDQAVAGAASFDLAGYHDWRLPNIKELYSLILFDGTDVSACKGSCTATPFIDTRYFKFSYGAESAGERTIDAQYASSTRYIATTMNGVETMFGVNFADGRIKGYPINAMPGQSEGKQFFVLYVRGNPDYAINHFMDNGDGTLTDNATGLTWTQSDSAKGLNWQEALAYCENLTLAGLDDWHLPNAKELQSIVDYTRAPAITHSAAIDPLFKTSRIQAENKKTDYPFYWSSTTHADTSGNGAFAVYVAFGEALGYMNNAWIDVHGAGAQRSDPKSGSVSNYASGHGPQGDAVRIYNYARCVRSNTFSAANDTSSAQLRPAMHIQSSGSLNVGQPASNGNTAQPAGGVQNPQPPQAAINACLASTVGSACHFSSPNGMVNGICKQLQQDLACVP